MQTRLLNQVDERRSPRTEATVNELLNRRWRFSTSSARPAPATLARSRSTFGRTIGRLQVARVRPRRSTASTHSCGAAGTTATARSTSSTEPMASTSATSTARADRVHRSVPGPVRLLPVVRARLPPAPMHTSGVGEHPRRPRHLQRRLQPGRPLGVDRRSPIDQADPPPVPRPNFKPAYRFRGRSVLLRRGQTPTWGRW